MNLPVTIHDSMGVGDRPQRQATIRRTLTETLGAKDRAQRFDYDRRIAAQWGQLPGRVPFDAPGPF